MAKSKHTTEQLADVGKMLGEMSFEALMNGGPSALAELAGHLQALKEDCGTDMDKYVAGAIKLKVQYDLGTLPPSPKQMSIGKVKTTEAGIIINLVKNPCGEIPLGLPQPMALPTSKKQVSSPELPSVSKHIHHYTQTMDIHAAVFVGPRPLVSTAGYRKIEKSDKPNRIRFGDQFITVKFKVEPAVIDFKEILDATKIEDDEDCRAPWEECDGFEHEAIDVDELEGVGHLGKDGDWVPHYNRRDIVVPHSSRQHLLIVVSREQVEKWGCYSRLPGEAKQVAFERGAAERRRSLEQLKFWHHVGWSWYCVSCDFMGVQDSLGGIDEDYAQEDVVPEVAGNVAHELEQQGYTIINKPLHGKPTGEALRSCLQYKIAHNLGFADKEGYLKWLRSPPLP